MGEQTESLYAHKTGVNMDIKHSIQSLVLLKQALLLTSEILSLYLTIHTFFCLNFFFLRILRNILRIQTFYISQFWNFISHF